VRSQPGSGATTVFKGRHKERRKAARRVINRVAQYHCGAGTLPRPCMITDISDNGARLYSDVDMPDTFVLSVSGEHGDDLRECRVVWRLGGEFGVTFCRPDYR
jgi:hypothetical protein